MSKGFASDSRLAILAGVIFAGLGVVGWRLVSLHVWNREELLGTIARARQQLIVEEARRGDILDRRGTVLATSYSSIIVGVDPQALRPQDEPKWPELAAILGLPEAQLRQTFARRHAAPKVALARSPAPAPAANPVAFRLALDAEAAPAAATEDEDEVEGAPDEQGRRLIRWAKLKEISEGDYLRVKALGIKGVYGNPAYRRAYPNHELASHLIGYVNRQGQPVAGMEYYADFYLRAQKGWRVGERDGRNNELAQFRVREVPRADGYSVSLTLDAAVQDLVEQELRNIGRKFQPLKATIIVSDPRTGFILGLGNYPTFDPNAYNEVPTAEQHRLRNLAVADIYEPGSVFKIVAAAGALEEGLVRMNEVFDCSLDKVAYEGRMLGLPAEAHRLGDLNLAGIISHSSNKGAAQLGLRLGKERLYRYARAFGFGRPLGFPVGGEVAGLLAPPEKWYPIDITRIPMGHTVSATALQMHQAMSVIANDGVLMRPQVIQQIRDASGQRVFSSSGVEIGRAVSVTTARTVAQLLMGVASKGGTAPEAAIPGFEVAGKTGTSQKLMEVTLPSGARKLEYSSKHHVASFVGFFPASRPRVVISVIVDDADARAPGGIAYGATVAVPSFRSLAEKLIPVLNLKAPGAAAAPSVPPLLAAVEGRRR